MSPSVDRLANWYGEELVHLLPYSPLTAVVNLTTGASLGQPGLKQFLRPFRMPLVWWLGLAIDTDES